MPYPLTQTWDATYQGNPPDAQDARLGANRIRDFKREVRERMEIDHLWADASSVTEDGKHNQMTMPFRSPAPGTPVAGDVVLYATGAVGATVLQYKDSAGDVHVFGPQSGFIQMAAFDVTTPPDGWLECNGQSVDSAVAEFANLFTVIGNNFDTQNGASAPGGTLFRVPNFIGTMPMGFDSSAGDARYDTVGNYAGTDSHTVLEANIEQFNATSGNNSVGHTHTFPEADGSGFNGNYQLRTDGTVGPGTTTTSNISANHTHITAIGTVSATAIDHRPKYVVVGFLIKI